MTIRFDADDLMLLVHLVAEALGFLEGVDTGARGGVPDFHSSVIAGRDFEAILLRCNSVCCKQCNVTQCLKSYAMLSKVLFFFSQKPGGDYEAAVLRPPGAPHPVCVLCH